MDKAPQSVNFFNLRPRQLYPSVLAENGKVIVLIPEQRRTLVEWFLRKKRKTSERIKLDILGSVVWESCNGTRTVQEIANRVKQEYGKFAEPVDVRVRNFVQRLQDSRFIDVGITKENK